MELKPNEPVSVDNYQLVHQAGIDQMMQRIAAEFSEPISLPLAEVPALLKKLPQPYWVALHKNSVIGTAGIAALSDGSVALRRMFIDKAFRGTGLSSVLLNKALAWAKEKHTPVIYLGTMQQVKAAQKFYEKNGFTKIVKAELPGDFPLNPIDVVFYSQTFSY